MQDGPADGLVVVVTYRNGQHGAEAEHAAGHWNADDSGIETTPGLLAATAGNVFAGQGIFIVGHCHECGEYTARIHRHRPDVGA